MHCLDFFPLACATLRHAPRPWPRQEWRPSPLAACPKGHHPTHMTLTAASKPRTTTTTPFTFESAPAFASPSLAQDTRRSSRRRHHVEPSASPRHAGRVPGPLPGQAGPPRSPKGLEAGPHSQEADPGTPQEGRDPEGLPEGQGAPLQTGSRPADGPDGRHG